MPMKRNEDIREAAKAAGVRLWEIGDVLGIADYTLSRRLRYELDPDEREEIFAIIERILEERQQRYEQIRKEKTAL